MKTKPHNSKIMTCAFLFMPVISMLSLQAQDYLISFEGTGASTTVDSVTVDNLTQGTKLKMKGSDILHLMGVVTGIEKVRDNETDKIAFYPNPMKDQARMQFDLPEKGETVITLYDLSGKKIAQTRDLLPEGQNTYRILGIDQGLYIASISSGRYSFNGRLVSFGSRNGSTKIIYENTENTMASQKKLSDSKGTYAETVMQYTIGDRLKLTGFSGNYCTVITDVPSIPGGSNFHIFFDFVPCTDGDGNNYSSVRIGSQIWMAENLKTTKYITNLDIPNVTNNAEWSGLTGMAYSWYNNDIKNKNIYGALYNYYAASDGRLCPMGWHVPVLTEWIRLSDYLGGADNAGGKLKENSTTLWLSQNIGATNETGFTALPGGIRYGDGTFFGPGKLCYWWWLIFPTGGYSPYAMLLNTSGSFLIGSYYGSAGMSVRCLKDCHITDIDGNCYTTVEIGKKVWMVENLKTTHLNDGTAIPLVTDNTGWSLLTTPGYCWWNNDEPFCKNHSCGALYNWHTVNTGKLCPTGWHVPTKPDWIALTDYLGGEDIAGGKLKETGTTHWPSPNYKATNETGFTALPGGLRYNTGGFDSNFGGYVHWWTATEHYQFFAYSLNLSSTSGSVMIYSNHYGNGYSVRCVKD